LTIRSYQNPQTRRKHQHSRTSLNRRIGGPTQTGDRFSDLD
jgi:hypothetical protein